MKLRILKLTPESLSSLLQGKQNPNATKLPSDLEILDAKMDLFARQISLIVRSESFEEVSETMPIPELTQQKDVEAPKTAPKPAAPIKPQAAPLLSPVPSSNIAKLPTPQPSRMATKMENEFTPEQRKLLSFTAKEDCVVVKPVMFLKAEWEDINEVVRSLGGRWVKGDIISYWEIPLQ